MGDGHIRITAATSRQRRQHLVLDQHRGEGVAALAKRCGTSRMVKPSGRRAGSSSSSQSMGADTGRPRRRPRAVGRDEGLVDRVLGVVEPGQARRARSTPTSS